MKKIMLKPKLDGLLKKNIITTNENYHSGTTINPALKTIQNPIEFFLPLLAVFFPFVV